MKTVSIRLEDNDYSLLDEILHAMGQTKQTFYESYTKTVIRQRKIPFTIEAPEEDPFYSAENMTRLRKSIDQLNAGHGKVHDLVEVD